MTRTSRNKPTNSGPGGGTPRSRTAARPGERASAQRQRTREAPPAVEPEGPAEAGMITRVGNRALSATWRLLVLGVVLAVIAVTLFQSLRIYFAQSAEIAVFRAEIQARRAEISELEDQLARWEDPKFVEAEARERLGWVMPGEIGFRVVGADGKPIGGEGNVLGEDSEAADGPWFQRMWGSVAVADNPAGADEPTPGPSPSPSRTE